MDFSFQSFSVPIPFERWMIAAIGLSAFVFGWMLASMFGSLRRHREHRRRLVETLHRVIVAWYQQVRELCAAPASENRAKSFALVQSQLILPDLLVHLDEAMRLRRCRRLAERTRAFLDHVAGGDEAPVIGRETIVDDAGELALAVRVRPTRGPSPNFLGKLDSLFEEVSAEAVRLAN